MAFYEVDILFSCDCMQKHHMRRLSCQGNRLFQRVILLRSVTHPNIQSHNLKQVSVYAMLSGLSLVLKKQQIAIEAL